MVIVWEVPLNKNRLVGGTTGRRKMVGSTTGWRKIVGGTTGHWEVPRGNGRYHAGSIAMGCTMDVIISRVVGGTTYKSNQEVGMNSGHPV